MSDEQDDVALDAFEQRALRALAAAERLDPPAVLAAGVMQAVRERSLQDARPRERARVLGDRSPDFWSPGRRLPRNGIGTASRRLMLGIAAAAVLAIAVFAVKGFPPVGPGSEATVGAARKHPTEPAAAKAKDVAPQNPEIQRVLQSDSFRKLVSNPEMLAILSSKDFQKAIASPEVQAFLAQAANDPSVAQALEAELGAVQDAGLQKLLADPAFTKALGDRAFLDGISSADFLEAAKSGALAAAIDQAVSAQGQ